MTPPVAPSALLNEEEQKRAVTNCLKRVKRGKVKPFELRVLAFEIRDVGFTPHAALPTLQHLVRELINKASEGYGECAEHCSALCSSLLPILPTFKPPGPAVGGTQKRIDFRSALLNAVQKGFEQCVSSADGMVWLDGPSNNSTAENHPCSSDSGSKRTSLSSIGVVSFVSQLFRYGLLTERILLGCLSGLAKAATASASATHQLDCAIHLLKLAGRDLGLTKSEANAKMLDGIMVSLGTWRNSVGLQSDVSAHLQQLMGQHAQGWTESATTNQPDDESDSMPSSQRSRSQVEPPSLSSLLRNLSEQSLPATKQQLSRLAAEGGIAIHTLEAMADDILQGALASTSDPSAACELYARLVADVQGELPSFEPLTPEPASAGPSPAASPNMSRQGSCLPQSDQVGNSSPLGDASPSARTSTTGQAPITTPTSTRSTGSNSTQPSTPASASGASAAAANRQINLRRLLLNALQVEFERSVEALCGSSSGGSLTPDGLRSPASASFNNLQQLGDATPTDSPSATSTSQAWRDDAGTKRGEGRSESAQAQAVVCMLSAMFRNGQLTERIVLACAGKLLDACTGSEACAICLCQLFSTTGKLLDNSSKADTRTKFAAAVAKLERMYYGTSLGEEGRAHVVRLLDQRAAGWQ